VDDKIHAAFPSGPYSADHAAARWRWQAPVAADSASGGMEVRALEVTGGIHSAKSCWTAKSDDVYGRTTRLNEAIGQAAKLAVEPAYRMFNVLIREVAIALF